MTWRVLMHLWNMYAQETQCGRPWARDWITTTLELVTCDACRRGLEQELELEKHFDE